MITNLIAALGVILIIVGVLKLVGLVGIASAAAGTLIVIGIILVVIAYFIGGGPRFGVRT